nr:hypothetical protein [uncultured Acetatifactor sp.]
MPFSKNLDFIYSLWDCAPGTVPQPCDIGLPVSVHNEQGRQFRIVLRQYAEPPVQQFILQGGQPAKPPGIHIAGVPGEGRGFKLSEQAGLLTLVKLIDQPLVDYEDVVVTQSLPVTGQLFKVIPPVLKIAH